MVKLNKNEKLCVDCGKIIRVSNNRQKRCKSCAVKKNRENALKRNRRIRSIGTPATWDLSPNAVRKQLDLIINNVDKGGKVFNNDKSKRDVVLERMVYDEDGSIIREVF